jgi:hypothetical protein
VTSRVDRYQVASVTADGRVLTVYATHGRRVDADADAAKRRGQSQHGSHDLAVVDARARRRVTT